MPEPSSPKNRPSKKSTPDLATLVSRIDEIIQQIERSDTPLEQSVALFEEGIALTRHAQEILETAEQRVTLLIDESSDTSE